MKTILSLCFLLLSTITIAQAQAWSKVENEKIPEGLKAANATLYCIVFSDDDIKEFGLHEKYIKELYNEFVVKYSEKYFTGKTEYISWAEYEEQKDDIEFLYLPLIYEPGRAEGIAPRSFCVVDVPNETAYSRRDTSSGYVAVGSMKNEIILDFKFIAKQRKNK